MSAIEYGTKLKHAKAEKQNQLLLANYGVFCLCSFLKNETLYATQIRLPLFVKKKRVLTQQPDDL